MNRSWLLGQQDALVSLLRAAAMSLLLVALFPIPNLWVAAPVVINTVLLVGVLAWSWPDLAVFGG